MVRTLLVCVGMAKLIIISCRRRHRNHLVSHRAKLLITEYKSNTIGERAPITGISTIIYLIGTWHFWPLARATHDEYH